MNPGASQLRRLHFRMSCNPAGLGFTQGEEQNASVTIGIRVLTSLVPAFSLVLSIWIARGYPLTRAAHAKILEQLAARDGVP